MQHAVWRGRGHDGGHWHQHAPTGQTTLSGTLTCAKHTSDRRSRARALGLEPRTVPLCSRWPSAAQMPLTERSIRHLAARAALAAPLRHAEPACCTLCSDLPASAGIPISTRSRRAMPRESRPLSSGEAHRAAATTKTGKEGRCARGQGAARRVIFEVIFVRSPPQIEKGKKITAVAICTHLICQLGTPDPGFSRCASAVPLACRHGQHVA